MTFHYFFRKKNNTKYPSWWFQPIWISQIGSLPQIGAKIKNIWNHHPVSVKIQHVTGIAPTYDFLRVGNTWQVGIETIGHSEAGNWWPRWWQHWRKIAMQRLPCRWPSALTFKATSSQKLILKMCMCFTPIRNSKISFFNSLPTSPTRKQSHMIS